MKEHVEYFDLHDSVPCSFLGILSKFSPSFFICFENSILVGSLDLEAAYSAREFHIWLRLVSHDDLSQTKLVERTVLLLLASTLCRPLTVNRIHRVCLNRITLTLIVRENLLPDASELLVLRRL